MGNLSVPIDIAYLFAIDGTLVKSYGTIDNQIDISEVQAGIYFLVLEQDDASTVKRIVKQ
ncbi:MAG: T9SS type A sorting domain-containing protein [Patiriisocius sp.]|uniref:T9SS type A sorting domain-containing protein n=1 Tax=Patiriisocius sp. TaxID=2822396 RepID=UPI003EF2B16D